MMTFTNTEDPWIDYLIISRLGGCYATPIIQFFQDGRCRIKIDPQPESTTQPKARELLHMECDFAIALPYNSSMQRISTSRQMSWSTFQPLGSLVTIEDFYQPAVLEMIKNYSEKLQDYSNLLLSTAKCSRACRAYTLGTCKEGRRQTPTRIPL